MMKIGSGSRNCCFYLLLFYSLSRNISILPYEKIFSFFDPCHATFPCKELLSFFSRFVQKVEVLCSSDSFLQKITQQAGGNCNGTSNSQILSKRFKNVPFYFCNYIWKGYCEQRVLHCPPRCRDRFFTELYI